MKSTSFAEMAKDITLLTLSKRKDLHNTEMAELVLQFKTAGFAEKFFAALSVDALCQYDESRVYPFNQQVCFYVKDDQNMDRLYKVIQGLVPPNTYTRRCNLVLKLVYIDLSKLTN